MCQKGAYASLWMSMLLVIMYTHVTTESNVVDKGKRKAQVNMYWAKEDGSGYMVICVG